MPPSNGTPCWYRPLAPFEGAVHNRLPVPHRVSKMSSEEPAVQPANKRPYIGGQAVIEGVMMRSPKSFAVVIRRRDESLTATENVMPDARKGVLSWPTIRGVVTLVESLRLGSRALRFSAEYYEADLEEEERTKTPGASGVASTLSIIQTLSGVIRSITGGLVALATSDLDEAPSAEVSKSGRLITTVSLLFVVLLFVALPQIATAGAGRLFGMDLDIRSPTFQVITGVFKLVIVLGYMLAIRWMPEIRRVFMFHGAEHKAIATYEAGEELTVENARAKSRFHPRCGTTFLIMVVFVSILVFSGIGHLLPKWSVGVVGENVVFFLMKLPFLPVIASLTYEIQRLTARFCVRGPLRLVLYPGFAVQGITALEPNDAQIEVALASLQTTLWREQADGNLLPSAEVKHYRDFAHIMDRSAHVAPEPFTAS